MMRWLSSPEDKRPKRYGWAPGTYISKCSGVGCKDLDDKTFIGDKRAIMCADCAYALPDHDPKAVSLAIDDLIRDNPDKVEQALTRAELLPWFTGQVMKRLGGKADVYEVHRAVLEKIESVRKIRM